jgi:hypothetical protein
MDYIASSMVNAFAFYFEGWYFIGITDGMLELFAKSCTALWRLEPLAESLGIDPAREKRDSVFQFVLLLELQYISNHELGHMFHGHCAGLRDGRYRAEFDVATLVANSIGMEGQARELEQTVTQSIYCSRTFFRATMEHSCTVAYSRPNLCASSS